jgi:hypothetical protein
MNNNTQPTPEQPFLVGFLFDVSASMTTIMRNSIGKSKTRLASMIDAFEQLIQKNKDITTEDDTRVSHLVKIIAYGFGFGNPLQMLFNKNEISVRNLLGDEFAHPITIDDLANNWDKHKQYIENLKKHMLGATPIKKGITIIHDVILKELKENKYTGNPVLFILSDGDPTDSSHNDIKGIIDNIKQSGIMIISCYVTNEDILSPRQLYGKPRPDWPEGATLMFECASDLPEPSPFDGYLQEYKWSLEPNSKLFAQINQSDILSEFINLVISPLQDNINQDSNNSEEIMQLIDIKKRRLRELEKKQALFGLQTDPSVIIEIEDIENDLIDLNIRLNK